VICILGGTTRITDSNVNGSVAPSSGFLVEGGEVHLENTIIEHFRSTTAQAAIITVSPSSAGSGALLVATFTEFRQRECDATLFTQDPGGQLLLRDITFTPLDGCDLAALGSQAAFAGVAPLGCGTTYTDNQDRAWDVCASTSAGACTPSPVEGTTLHALACRCPEPEFVNEAVGDAVRAPYLPGTGGCGGGGSSGGCIKPMRLTDYAVISKVVSVGLSKPSLVEQTVDVTLYVEGNDIDNPAHWTVLNALSIASWLQLPASTGVANPHEISAGNTAVAITLILNASGLRERAASYDDKLMIDVRSSANDKVARQQEVNVVLTIEASTSYAVWGAVPLATSERAARLSCNSAPNVTTAAVVQTEAKFHFTACDSDSLPVEHSIPSARDNRQFIASVQSVVDGSTYAAVVVPQGYGVYHVAFTPQLLGEYVVNASLAGVALPPYRFSPSCQQGQEPTPDGRSCGCARGSRLVDGQCTLCPLGYSTEVGETECLRCAEGFYAPMGFENPESAASANCQTCLAGARCPWNATTRDLLTLPNRWRLTAESSDIMECLSDWDPATPTPCSGGGPSNCTAGHEGPKCEVCAEELHHVTDDGLCTKCPNGSMPVVAFAAAISVLAVLLYVVYLLLVKPPASLKPVSDALTTFFLSAISIGPGKIKSAITFYQIIMSMTNSFDLNPITADYSTIISIFTFLELDWSEWVYPTGCLIGGYTLRVIIVSLTPFILIISFPVVLLVILFIASFLSALPSDDDNGEAQTPRTPAEMPVTPKTPVEMPTKPGEATPSIVPRGSRVSRGSESSRRSSRRASAAFIGTIDLLAGAMDPQPPAVVRGSSTITTISRSTKITLSLATALLPWILFIVFLVLPSVSRTIFSVWDCIPYTTGPSTSVNYLRRDLSVICDGDDHQNMVLVAVAMVILWPMGMQLFLFSMLWSNRTALRAGIQNSQSRATRFISGGYRPPCFYWETVELFRRLTCSGFVVLIPQEYISMRILMAIVVSLPILVMTAYVQPFKKASDTKLALVAQTILIFAYLICAVIRVLNSTAIDDEARHELLGFSSAEGGFLALCFCCLGFLIMLFAAYCRDISEEFTRQAAHRGASSEGSSVMVMVAMSSSLAALCTAGALFGMVVGIISAIVFFFVGAALGAFIYYRCFKVATGAAYSAAQSVTDRTTIMTGVSKRTTEHPGTGSPDVVERSVC